MRDREDQRMGGDSQDEAVSMPALLAKWRDRTQVDTLSEAVPQHLWKKGRLTQAAMAHLLEISDRHYRRLENGTASDVGVRVIERAVEVLDLKSAEEAALYRWCGHRPPVRPRQYHADPRIPEQLITMLHSVGHGAYWSDSTYSVLVANARARWHWPWMQREDANIMRELLRPADGSQGRAQCVDWERRWAPHLVAHLRRGAVAEPEHACLQGLVADVREHALVRRIWDRDERGDLVHHAYGTIRPMTGMTLFGADAVVEVAIEALVPPSRPDLRLVLGIPVGVPEPPPAGPPPPPMHRTDRPRRGRRGAAGR
ncbi:helix-turn-helix domain-containing protein [Streptomyces sp. SM12]|uniref:MmyB family transcriptional regulator n=1 Tax=Streptomyces sp. SM12 TaxID=1071602 RepID=UPI0015E1AE0F|nr:helix-turn-helix domain-containing protein [Streptomyces sp. SM12]